MLIYQYLANIFIMFGMHLVNVCKMIHRKFQLASSLPSLLGASSPPESPQYSSFWISYMMQFYPGWPNHQSLGECIFSMFLVFLLAFTTEICSTSNDPISIKQQCRRRRHDVRGLLLDAGLHGLRMFMAYLVMISVITGDFLFLLVALAGHTAGCLFTKLFEYQIEQTIAEPRSKQASKPWVT
ncbi:unnamed protein product [Coffea canephora]|uniref:Copper transporter n=1 Tax=Coffea canephora TaxID=49390 RepID=A0A068UFZ0_COFCA|nr:unnamed protein product [Coffea canephora]